jgi:hypothetical protein
MRTLEHPSSPQSMSSRKGAYVSVEYNRIRTAPTPTFEEISMGQVVSLSQHQATKNMQIREAEQRAKEALHQASLAYKELHRLKGD